MSSFFVDVVPIEVDGIGMLSRCYNKKKISTHRKHSHW